MHHRSGSVACSCCPSHTQAACMPHTLSFCTLPRTRNNPSRGSRYGDRPPSRSPPERCAPAAPGFLSLMSYRAPAPVSVWALTGNTVCHVAGRAEVWWPWDAGIRGHMQRTLFGPLLSVCCWALLSLLSLSVFFFAFGCCCCCCCWVGWSWEKGGNRQKHWAERDKASNNGFACGLHVSWAGLHALLA